MTIYIMSIVFRDPEHKQRLYHTAKLLGYKKAYKSSPCHKLIEYCLSKIPIYSRGFFKRIEIINNLILEEHRLYCRDVNKLRSMYYNDLVKYSHADSHRSVLSARYKFDMEIRKGVMIESRIRSLQNYNDIYRSILSNITCDDAANIIMSYI